MENAESRGQSGIQSFLTNTILISFIPIFLVIGYNTYYGVFYDTNISFINQAIYVLNIGLVSMITQLLLSGVVAVILLIATYERGEKIRKSKVGIILLYALLLDVLIWAFVDKINGENGWFFGMAGGAFLLVLLRIFKTKNPSKSLLSIPTATCISLVILIVFFLGYNSAFHNHFYLVKSDDKSEPKSQVIMVNNGQVLIKESKTGVLQYIKMENKYVIIKE
ncbi:hypothetical protein ACIQLG_16615 [Terribacillus saccharophilus]|uniref:hypothetical protein n=1 Tax=Terribacillus saccharophilus TaxID=361277 RepID=UPI0038046D2A